MKIDGRTFTFFVGLPEVEEIHTPFSTIYRRVRQTRTEDSGLLELLARWRVFETKQCEQCKTHFVIGRYERGRPVPFSGASKCKRCAHPKT